MWKLFFNPSTLMVLFSALALVNVTACSNNKAAKLPNQTASAIQNAPVASAAEPPVKPHKPVASPRVQQRQPSNTPHTYQQAINVATGAISISESAVSRDDWSLVAIHWQKAIELLKVVPPKTSHYKTAQKKLSEYRSYLADAKLRATPAPQKSCGDTNPEFFSVPIKGKVAGIPIVEVTFNNNQKFDMLFDTGASRTLITRPMAMVLGLPTVGITRGRIADGSVVTLPVALIKSQEIDGRFKINAPVAVAPQADIGLLGQDFYKGYDIAIKEDAIEFRRQHSRRSINQRKTTCLVDTKPQSFRIAIKSRMDNIPVVEVTFNDKHKFPMLFDTGASGTLISKPMAVKLGLAPVGISRSGLADGSVATFAIAIVKSQKIAGRIKRDVEVSVAPSALDIGLLGQDFFEGYDYTIKENVIEFRRRQER